MDDTQLTAAERRKQRILAKGSERMAKVMGTYGQDAGAAAEAAPGPAEEAVPAQPESRPSGERVGPQAEPSPQAMAAADTAPGTRAAVRRRGMSVPPEPARAVDDSELGGEAGPSGTPGALDAPSTPLRLTLADAVSAAAYQTQAVRLLSALVMAWLAYGGTLMPWPSPVVQMLASNMVILTSATWLLATNPKQGRLVYQQQRVRFTGGMMQQLMQLAVGKQRLSVAKAVLAVGWAAYMDSGSYLVFVTLLYVAFRTRDVVPVEVPVS